MLKKIAPIVLALIVSGNLAPTAEAASPSGRSFQGSVDLYRAGITFPFYWDITFHHSFQIGPNLHIGTFNCAVLGFPQSGWYVYDSATDRVSGFFNNQWHSRFTGRYYDASIFFNDVFVVETFADIDGNQLAYPAWLFGY